ncbi:MAG: hypothetical protein VB096_02455 [Pseudoflavonifractor sp.]|nr:hypothetical protein [Pseudoflavonifractor sp.]
MKRNIDICSDLITPRVALSLIPAFKSAYGMAAYTADTIDFLGGELKEQILPHLKNWAVEYELHRRCAEGIIPFDSSFALNSRKNHRHLELRRDGFVLTVSQTPHIHSMPRECIFRNDHNLDGQLIMEGCGLDDLEGNGDVYAILTHGQGSATPGFVLCGIPNVNMTYWSQHVNLLSAVRDIAIVDESPVNDDIQLDFRDVAKSRIKEAQ